MKRAVFLHLSRGGVSGAGRVTDSGWGEGRYAAPWGSLARPIGWRCWRGARGGAEPFGCCSGRCRLGGMLLDLTEAGRWGVFGRSDGHCRWLVPGVAPNESAAVSRYPVVRDI